MRSQVETRWPRPTPPSRVNGCLGLALARSTFSLRSLSVRIGDPIRALPRLRFFRDAPYERRTKLLPCHRPTRHSTCPQSSRCCPAPLSRRGTSSGVNGSVPGTAIDRWRRLVKATATPAFLRALADPLSRDPRDLPRRARPRHPPSSTDDHQGWVVPRVFPADLDPTRRPNQVPFPAVAEGTGAPPAPRPKSDDVSFTPGSSRP